MHDRRKGDDAAEANETADLTLAVTSGNVVVGSRSVLTLAIEGDDEQPPPTGLTVTPGDQQLMVSWTAPSGVSGTSGYELAFTSSTSVANDAESDGTNPAVAWVEVRSLPTNTATSYTIDSNDATLTNGVTYRVRLRTLVPNSAYVYGTGTPVSLPPTLWSGTLTAKTIPGDPGIYGCSNQATGAITCRTSATLTDDDFELGSATWEIERVFGANTPGDVTVVFNNDVRTALDSYKLCVGSSELAFSSATHSNNQTAAWSSTIASSWGAGDMISLSISQSCEQDHSKPTGLALSAGTSEGELIAQWTAPTGGLTITRYEVQQKLKSAADWPSDDTDVSSSSTSHTFTGLEGSTYEVRVRTVYTEEGSESKSYWSAAKEITLPPAAPTDLEAVTGTGKLDLTWTAPAGTVTGYDVHYTSAEVGTVADDASASGNDPAAAWVEVTRTSTDTTASQEITPLTNGTAYRVRVRVRARNDAVASDWAHDTGVPLAAPTWEMVTAGDEKLDLTWIAPTGTVTGYDVHYTSAPTSGNGAVEDDAMVQTGQSATADNGWVTEDRGTEADPPATSQTITGLENNTVYRVRVRAKNAGGNSAWLHGTGTPQADTTVPAPTFSPADDKTETDNTTDITLTFEEAVKKDNQNGDFMDGDLPAILMLKQNNDSGTDIPYTASINAGKTVITLDPTSTLPDGRVYVAISNAYYDEDGNPGTAASATFTVTTRTAPPPVHHPPVHHQKRPCRW